MQPNDLPIVCLPMDLSDEAAAAVVDFLHELTEALERHYCGQLKLAWYQRNLILTTTTPCKRLK